MWCHGRGCTRAREAANNSKHPASTHVPVRAHRVPQRDRDSRTNGKRLPRDLRAGQGIMGNVEPYDLTDSLAVLAQFDAARTRELEAKYGCKWSERGMSNFDHSIDDGLADDLKAGMRATHSAYEFNGQIWWDPDGQVFKEDVWRYHALAATRSAPTLDDLMRVVNDEFGWE